jgi:hypothetical protein
VACVHEVSWQERCDLDESCERLSEMIRMRDSAERCVHRAQREVLALCAQHEVPAQVRSDGSVRVPEGWPLVRRA